MADPVQLHGYRYSVYNRIARLALLSKKVEHQTIEVNPFAELSEAYLRLHPFGRVPVLTHGAFRLFETSAITRYVDRAFTGRPLQPEGAAALARMDQVIAVIDAYAYWPMVRQVSSHAFSALLSASRRAVRRSTRAWKPRGESCRSWTASPERAKS